MSKSAESVKSSEKVLWEGSPELGLVLRNGVLMAFLSPVILVTLSFLPVFDQIVTVVSGVFLMVMLVLVTISGLYYYIKSTDYIVTESNIYVFSVLGNKQAPTSKLSSVNVKKNSGLINIDRNNADVTLRAGKKIKFRNVGNSDMVENILRNDFNLRE